MFSDNVKDSTVLLTSDTSDQNASIVNDGDKRNISCVSLGGIDSWLQVDTKRLHVIKAINVVFKDCTFLGFILLLVNLFSR